MISKKISKRLFDFQYGLCWLCGTPMDPDLRDPDPMTISRDHLIPKSKGGSGLRNNIALAHAVCNSRRGNDGVLTLRSARAALELLAEHRIDDQSNG